MAKLNLFNAVVAVQQITHCRRMGLTGFSSLHATLAHIQHNFNLEHRVLNRWQYSMQWKVLEGLIADALQYFMSFNYPRTRCDIDSAR